MASWPVGFPAPLVDGYKVSPVDNVVRTDMEGGNVRARLRSRARIDVLSAAVLLDNEQFSNFRGWYDDGSTGINGGTYWFSVDLKTGNSSGPPMETVTAQFAGMWSADYIPGGYWQVSMPLRVRYA